MPSNSCVIKKIPTNRLQLPEDHDLQRGEHYTQGGRRNVDRRANKWLEEAGGFMEAISGVAKAARIGGKGPLLVYDGWTTKRMAEIAGVRSIYVKIVEVKNESEFALLFDLSNGLRKPVGALDQYKSRLKSKNEKALAVDGVLKEVGLTLGNEISCVNTLMSCCERYGAENLTRGLRILALSWGANKLATAYQAASVAGIVLACVKGEGISDAQFVKALRRPRNTLSSLKQRMGERGISGEGRNNAIAELMMAEAKKRR